MCYTICSSAVDIPGTYGSIRHQILIQWYGSLYNVPRKLVRPLFLFLPLPSTLSLILQNIVKHLIGTVPTQWDTKSPLPASLLVPRSHPQIAQPRLLTSSLTRTYQV